MQRFLLIILGALLYFMPTANAQRSSEAGIFLGVANYMGDFAPTPIAASETNLVFGGQYRYMLNTQLGIKGSVSFGKISGDYLNKPGSTRDLQMETGLLEIGLQAEWHFLATSRFNNAGVYTRQASPFIGGGLAVAFGESKVTAPLNDTNRYPEADDKSAFVVFPITLGMRFDISEGIIMTGEFGLRATLSDYLDGVSQTGNPDKNDHYFFGGISVLYLIEAEYVPAYRN
jgi:OOP family OmpA-OmpF porin